MARAIWTVGWWPLARKWSAASATTSPVGSGIVAGCPEPRGAFGRRLGRTVQAEREEGEVEPSLSLYARRSSVGRCV